MSAPLSAAGLHRLIDIECGCTVIGADLVVRAAEVLHLEIADLFADPPGVRTA